MSILSAAFLLFLVIDPIGNIPLFLGVLKNVDEERHKKIILRELIIGFVVLLAFLLFGRYILILLQISETALSIAGGIVLFMIAIKMVFKGSEKIFEGNLDSEPFIVPLAVPLIAGPSAMASVMLLVAREPKRMPEWIIALVFAWFISGIILYFSDYLSKLLRKRALTAVERLMGMVLTTVAVQMLITGIRESLCS